MFPGMFRPGTARSGTQHAYAYDDPIFDSYLARSRRPNYQTPDNVYADSTYEDHLYHRQPRHFHDYHEPRHFPSAYGLNSTRRAPHRHLAEFDPGYIDLRFLPAFTLDLGPGPSALQQVAGAARHSQHGSPGPQAGPNVRQVPVEDDEVLPYDVLTSQFPGVSRRYAHPPSLRASSCHAASQHSEADFGEDSKDRDQTLEDLAYDPRWVKRQQQANEQMLRQQRAQEEQEYRLAQQAKERRLQEQEQQRRLAQHLHEKRLAEAEQERRLAYQHMQEERLQQLLYQRRREQELAEEELRMYEAAQRQQRLQQQRQKQQRQQQQLAEALLQQQKQEQEAQRQQKLTATLLQQRHQQQQQQQSVNTQQARAQNAAGEHQKMPQQLQSQQQQQQQQTDSDERSKGQASMQQPPDDATTIIHKLMRSNSVRAEQPMLEQLSKANAKLTELSRGLREVTSCVSAIKAEESGLPAKLRQCQGQLESPEQLQKRLVELGERGMQIVLSMDELHSENDKVRSLRKRIVKKALALMEDIDNVKSNMLHSILVHANDDQSEFSMPASGAVSEASEAVEEEDEEEEEDVKHESKDGPPAESDQSQGDQTLQQVANALAGLKVAEEAVHAPAAEEQPKKSLDVSDVDGGNNGS